MKRLLQTPTGKILIFLVKIMIVMILINVSFWLMDMASTVAFIVGILLIVGTVGFFIEHVIRKYFKQSKK